MQEKCTSCHDLNSTMNLKNRSENFWLLTIHRMEDHGLKISDHESKVLTTYLANTMK